MIRGPLAFEVVYPYPSSAKDSSSRSPKKGVVMLILKGTILGTECPVSVEWIYGSGGRSSGLDRPPRAPTQILAIAARNDLHADRTLAHEPSGDCQTRQAQRWERSHQKLRVPHALKPRLTLQVEFVRKG